MNSQRISLVGFLLILVLCASTCHLHAQEPLAWKFVVGDPLRYEITQQTKIDVDAGTAGSFSTLAKQTLDVVWKVRSINDDGTAEILQKIERLQIEISMPDGMSMEYDSASDEPPTGIAAMLTPLYEALLENEIPFTITRTGEIAQFKPTAELMERLTGVPATKAMSNLVTDVGLREITESIAFRLPAGALTKASQTERKIKIENRVLGRLTGDLVWKYYGQLTENADIERFAPKVILSIEPAPPLGEDAPPQPSPLAQPKMLKQRATGETHFDRAAGRMDNASLRIELDLTGDTAGTSINSHIDQTTTVRYKPSTE